jgi:acyl-CoA thioesterase-1
VKRLFVLCLLVITGIPAAADTSPILVFGDSISAGYGLAHVDEGWVQLLRTKLKSEGYGEAVVNASVSGETTAGGVARLPRALELHHPGIVIIELGGNDGLRALPLDQMRANLLKMVDLSTASGARVLLLGMRIPPNYGPEYTEKFFRTFADVAKLKGVALVPFLLSDVALAPDLMQADGVHPNERGQPKLLGVVWPALQSLLRKGAADGREPSAAASTLRAP